jgi:hypothetical protein
MIVRYALCCAVLFAFTAPASAADTKPSKKSSKPAVKSEAKPAAKSAAKPALKVSAKKPAPKRAKTKPVDKAAAKSATQSMTLKGLPPLRVHPGLVKTTHKPQATAAPVLHGPREVLTCRDGTEDRHARIAVVLVGGKTESFAYYSKWKPRTCSIYLQRNRDASRWSDAGSVTNVSADRGLFMIEHGKGEYRFVFRDVDRERYCGMDGTINGTLTIRKGSERCEIAGVMEEGVPLGQAVAHMEAAGATVAAAPAPAAIAVTTVPAKVTAGTSSTETSFFKRLLQHLHREPSAAWPTNAGGVSD